MRTRVITLLLSAILFTAGLFTPLQAGVPIARPVNSRASGDVLLQGFHWNSCRSNTPWWTIINRLAPNMASSGISMVWLPPSSHSASCEGYLPNMLYTLDSNYGTQDQLKQAIASLHNSGIKVLGDIVINHRVGTKDWADFTNPVWGPDAVVSDDEWPGAKGAPDTGAGFNAGRDIDHTKAYVRKSIIDWMNWLRHDIGYDGWRFDYVKGYAPVYTGMYIDATSPYFSVSELWPDLDLNNTDAHRQQLCDWMDAIKGKSAVFDFTTKGILQQAVAHSEYWRLRDRNGKPAGLIGWWPQNAVTFLDNHDTGPSIGDKTKIPTRSTNKSGQNLWAFPSDKVAMGYAYIMTHPGIPSVYWTHFYDWGTQLHNEIAALIQLRRSMGINPVSKVEILAADNTQYVAAIDGKVILKLGGGNWQAAQGWHTALTGNGYIIWTR